MPLRVAFAGTPAFAARSLEAIVAGGHSVPLVLTQPDRPAGRGLRLAASAVAQVAAQNGLTTLKTSTLKSAEVRSAIENIGCDAIVVAAFGILFPAEILALPRHGAINVHASLLPRWRGAAPIQRAILAGDSHTGISIMRMDEGLDTGPVLLQSAIPIAPGETSGSLLDKLATLGASCIVDALARLDGLDPIAQDSDLATYAAKITKAEARIDWAHAATQIDRVVRAFNPSPGAETRLDGQAVKIWEAEPAPGEGPPGAILEASARTGLRVACGRDALRVRSLQRAGGKRLSAGAFIAGGQLKQGQTFEPMPAGAPETPPA